MSKTKKAFSIFGVVWILLIIAYLAFGVLGKNIIEAKEAKEARIEAEKAEKLANGGVEIRVDGKEFILSKEEQSLVENLITKIQSGDKAAENRKEAIDDALSSGDIEAVIDEISQ